MNGSDTLDRGLPSLRDARRRDGITNAQNFRTLVDAVVRMNSTNNRLGCRRKQRQADRPTRSIPT